MSWRRNAGRRIALFYAPPLDQRCDRDPSFPGGQRRKRRRETGAVNMRREHAP